MENRAGEPSLALFAYGTLQLPQAQLATYGRLLEGEADTLKGYVLTALEIADPEVVRISGLAVHRIARESGNPGDVVAGMVLRLTQAELEPTDRYESDAYGRVEAGLASGRRAFVYVGPPLDAA